MPDRREEILNQEHRKFVEEKGISSIHTKDFPQAYKLQAFSAMDEYMKETCLELLDYVATGISRMNHNGQYSSFISNNGEVLSKEQLFENFL